MELAPADRAAVLALWRKLGTNVGIYTTEALERCARTPAPPGSPVFSALGGCVPRRPVPKPFLPSPRHQGAPHSQFPPQDLRGLPFLQDLLPSPKLESWLCPGQSPRPEGGRGAEPGHEPPGRPAAHPVGPARAAHAQAARGPGLLQVAVPLPAGDPRPALPRRLQPQHARLTGQVSEPRDLGAGPQQWPNWEGGLGGLLCLSKVGRQSQLCPCSLLGEPAQA